MGTDEQGFYDPAVPGEETEPPRIGHNSDAALADLIKGYITRAENLMAERHQISEDLKELWTEAKKNGLDDKALKFIIRERAMDKDVRAALFEMIDSYRRLMADD